jgi:porin
MKFDRIVKNAVLEMTYLEGYYRYQDSLKAKTGLSFGADYNAVFLGSTASGDSNNASSGVFRFYGSWDLWGRKTGNTGALIFKVEHRHKYGNIPPFQWGFQNGYVGIIQAPFNDSKFRVQNLYYRQRMFKGRATLVTGFMDVTDYLDIYALIIPWTQFFNLNFSTGGAAISLPNDGYLGIAAGGWVSKRVYAIAGFGDINSDPTKVFEGFNTFFNEQNYFKHVEVGFVSSKDKFMSDNIHVTAWHRDASQLQGTNEGWGLNFSASRLLGERWLPFLRGGYTKDGGSLLEITASAGFGYRRKVNSHLFAIGAHYGRPNQNTYGTKLKDQYTIEMFYRLQLSQKIAITPDVQFIVNPALNPVDNFIFVYALRGRIAI